MSTANDIFNITFKYHLVLTPEWSDAVQIGNVTTSMSVSAFSYYRSVKTTLKIRGTGKYFEALKKSGMIE